MRADVLDEALGRRVHRDRFVAGQARMNAMRARAGERFGDSFVDLTRSEPIAAWLDTPPDPDPVWQESRRYLPNAGLGPVRRAVARYYGEEFGVPIGPENVLVAPGGQSALLMALAALAGPGDSVLVPVPYFPSYPGLVELAGATPVLVQAASDDDLRLTAPALGAAATSATTAAILNNPVNPTGVLYDREEVEELLDALPAGVAWLVDEVYADVIHGGRPRPCAAAVLARLGDRPWLVLRSASKTIGRPGLRTAVLVGSPELITRVESISSLIAGAANAHGQAALAPALAAAAQAPASDAYERHLATALKCLEATPLRPLVPQGTYYVWARGPEEIGVGTIETAEELCVGTGVLVGPGELYGDPDAIRISISAPPGVLREGIARLADKWEGAR